MIIAARGPVLLVPVLATLVLLPLNRGVAEAAPPVPSHPLLTASQVVEKLIENNDARAEALGSYEGRRSYRLDYVGFPANMHAEMTVDMSYQSPATKEFRVVSESGSKWIINHIFKRLLDTEREAQDTDNLQRTALDNQNYNFTLLPDAGGAGGCRYELAVEPKIPNKFLFRGRIWVDDQDFAVCRIEAEPAQNPSFWIKRTEIQHAYLKVGDFWLPSDNRSVSSLRLGGLATLTIRYEDYKIHQAHVLNPIVPLPFALASAAPKPSNCLLSISAGGANELAGVLFSPKPEAITGEKSMPVPAITQPDHSICKALK